jgi:CRISPR-associated exonuclease Cas4
MYAEEDLLPLSGLQHFTFCERRWALIHLERQWAENLFTAEGKLLHDKSHSADIDSRPEVLVRRTLSLCSFRLGLSGQTDVVEFLPCAPGQEGLAMPRRKGLWRPYPIEYKRSRDKHGSSAYQIQLCAQALCLEEMLSTPVPIGAIFDGQTRRRVEVFFGTALRGEVEQLAARMHALCQSRETPPAVYEKKCERCSMKPLCLPSIAGSVSASRYLRRAVSNNLRLSVSNAANAAEEQD